MQPFSYERSRTAADARRRVAEAPGARYLAGGTNLIDYLKLDVLDTERLIDVARLPHAEIERRGRLLHLGAASRMSDAASHPAVRAAAPAIAEALEASASRQLRAMATLGGNILQRTRCAYYRDIATPCNKRRPGAGCGALLGLNDEHAVLGTSDACMAVHASDFAVPLVAFDATIVVQGRDGDRAISVREFFVPPGRTPERETPLDADDLIVAIEVPASAAATRSTYVKIRDRSSYAFALASCAAGVERGADGRLADVRIALGGVGTIPWRAREAEDVLRGAEPAPDRIREAARAAFASARPTVQNAYKIDLGIAAIVRALEAVIG